MTGVQTCALPILSMNGRNPSVFDGREILSDVPFTDGRAWRPLLPGARAGCCFHVFALLPALQSRALGVGTTAGRRLGVHDPPARWPRGAWYHAGRRLGGVVAAHMLQRLFCYIQGSPCPSVHERNVGRNFPSIKNGRIPSVHRYLSKIPSVPVRLCPS